MGFVKIVVLIKYNYSNNLISNTSLKISNYKFYKLTIHLNNKI